MSSFLNKNAWALLIGATALTATSCKKDSNEDTTPEPTAPTTYSFHMSTNGNVVTVSDSTNQNVTFTSDKVWLLVGFVKVQNGATLTIQPGTIIKGDKPTKATLIIERGGKINAAGTSTQPIVFTSNQPAGSRSYGDWGGVILCGKSPNNAGNNVLLEGGTGATFGGSDENDNSGVLQYVRIEFPGIAYAVNNEINGLTCGGVGAGTTIDHVQVSYSGDDSYEWFGGSVNCKYLVAFRGWDDDFDTDNGFRGKLQFGVGLRDPAIADQSGSNGFESDNDASGSGNTPATRAIFSNFSIYGPLAVDPNVGAMNALFKRGAHLRRNTQECLYNTVIAGYPREILVDGSTTGSNTMSDLLQVRNSTVAQWSAVAVDTVAAAGFDPVAWFSTSGYGNSQYSDISSLGLQTPFSLTNPIFLPNGGSPLLGGADFSNSNLSSSFFTPVGYTGAFGSEDWTNGWCNWDPQNTAY